MNGIIIPAPHLLSVVCEQIHSVQSLGLFAQVNKATWKYLMELEDGERHWTDVGKLTVGDAYWVQPSEEGSVRYYTKLQICPWMSVASKIPIRCINQEREDVESIYVKELRIRAVDDGNMICAILRSESQDMYAMAVRKQTWFVEIPAGGDFVENRTKAHDTRRRRFIAGQSELYARVEEADDFGIFNLKDSGWDEEGFNKVFKVHEGVFAVVQLRQYEADDDERADAVVHFMSYHTNRILHTLVLDTPGSRGVLFLPGGRMYLANGDGLDYYGPRKDRMTINA